MVYTLTLTVLLSLAATCVHSQLIVPDLNATAEHKDTPLLLHNATLDLDHQTELANGAKLQRHNASLLALHRRVNASSLAIAQRNHIKPAGLPKHNALLLHRHLNASSVARHNQTKHVGLPAVAHVKRTNDLDALRARRNHTKLAGSHVMAAAHGNGAHQVLNNPAIHRNVTGKHLKAANLTEPIRHGLGGKKVAGQGIIRTAEKKRHLHPANLSASTASSVHVDAQPIHAAGNASSSDHEMHSDILSTTAVNLPISLNQAAVVDNSTKTA